MAETEAREADQARDVPDTLGAPLPERPPAGSDGARTFGSAGRRHARRFVGSTPFLVLVALVVAIFVKTFLVQAFYIPSASMVPTLEIGDRVFVNKLAYDIGDIGRGDVIVFENPNPAALPNRGIVGGFLHWLGEGIGFAQPEDEDFIKRVIGLPGETLEIRDNVVYVDGRAIDEPYLTEAASSFNGDFPRTRIPQGRLFVMGDNRGNSADSRFGMGLVPVDRVIGKAFVVIWPPSHMGGLG
ncbi:MAG: signal peptidase I [Actinomycetota bacterium]